MPIQILSDDLVNQIAAGEVVERPSHLVKELVENSLDAGAKNIEIDFSEGGRRVRIWDDGDGMSPDDLELSVARHATSKIRKSEDLWQLNTFGFRGEALASIASVSRLKMQSRSDAGGSAIESEFGRIVDRREYQGDRGTRIEVADLFENVPVRLKFLRSQTAEHSAIKTLVKAVAMSRPDVSFRLLNEGKLISFWPATDSLRQRVEAVLEKNKLYSGTAKGEGFSAEVIIGSPAEVVQQNRQLWIFVNGRFVQDRNLQFAVMEAYRTFLMHGEYPIAAVFLTCPSEEVDVNVHPTKSQVKFRKANPAFRVVHQAVRQVLESAPWLEKTSAGARVTTPPPPFEVTGVDTELEFVAPEFSRHQAKINVDFGVSESAAFVAPIPAPPARSMATPSFEGAAHPARPFKWSDLMVIGQANLTYILTQYDQSLILVDQHAAHERVLFERLMSQWRNGNIEIQSLLIPMIVEVEQSQVEALRDHLNELAGMGIEISEMGPTTLAVRSLPALITEDSLHAAIVSLAEHIENFGQSFAVEKAVSEVFATMACHTAIRAGKGMSLEESRSLLEQMDEFRGSSFCPHGRPVSVVMPFTEIERRFGRIN